MNCLFVCHAEIRSDMLHCAGWIQGIVENIRSKVDIAFATPRKKSEMTSERIVRFSNQPLTVYFFDYKDPKAGIARITDAVHPDVIIIFGTEFAQSLYVLETLNIIGYGNKTTVFAQGFCSVCARHYAEGLPHDLLHRLTFRDFVRRDRICDQIRKFKKRAEVEQNVLQVAQNFIGRTTMDYTLLRLQNPTATYYKCNDILRKSFYETEWTYENCIKHRIFVSQYYYPLKGFHYLLEAVSWIKNKYPDLQIVAAGYNPIQKDFSHREWKDSSYIRYLKKLVCQYGLQENIKLTGELAEEEMVREYLNCNVFVMPSTIENSPNSLAEAMLLGVPSIVSDVGGVSDLATHGKEAYVYPSNAPYLLAHYLDEVFSHPENAIEMGRQGRVRALIEYDKQRNADRLCDVLSDIAYN